MEEPVARQAIQGHLPHLPHLHHHQDHLLAVDILMGGRITRLTRPKEPILDLVTMVRQQHKTATLDLEAAHTGMVFTAETREQTTQKCKRGFTQLQQRSNTCPIK